jgi:hypothetical protein
MESPHDVNSSQMRAVYGNRIRLDDPILGDNPKVAALRKEQSDMSIKTLIDEALKKFFFPEPTPDPESDTDTDLETETEPEPIVKKPTTDDRIPTLVSLFKILFDTVFNSKLKG